MVFKITLSKHEPSGSADSFTFEVARIKGTMRQSSGHHCFDDADVVGGTNVTPIMQQMTLNTRYDCYLGSSATPSNKLGMCASTFIDGSNIVLQFYSDHDKLDTGCCFGVITKNDGSQTTKIAIPNTDSTGIDADALANTEITSIQVLKNVLGQFKTAYQSKSTRLYTYGMWYLDTAFLVGITKLYPSTENRWYSSAYAGHIADSMRMGMRTFYVNLRSFWNWWSLLIGEFYFPVQWLETNAGKKVYLSLPITQPSNDDPLFYDNPDYPFQSNLKNLGKTSVCWDYQMGTNIMSIAKTPGNSVVFKNSTTLNVTKTVDQNSRYYYTYKFYHAAISGVGDEQPHECTGAFNINVQPGDMVTNNISTALGVTNPNYLPPTDDSYLLRAVTLVGTPYEEAGIAYYIDENEGQPSTFWNQYPTTPLQVMGVYTGIWNGPYPGGDWQNRAALWQFSNVGADLMLSNVAGYTQNSNYAYNKLINMFTTCDPNSAVSSFLNGGKMTVNSAVGARTLWGITSEVDPETPTGGGGSIGGGGGGSHSGGGGSFNDTGDNVGFSTGSSFGVSNTITNWHLGDLGSSELDTNLDLMGNWLRTTADPDAQAPWQGLGYKYSDKLANICSLKVIYAPSGPTLSGPLVPKIHGQVLHGTGDANPSAEKVTNQFKQTGIKYNFNLEEYFGSFLDYDPYTKIMIYLPFAGVQSLRASDVIGKDLSLIATVDFLTGDIVYNIRVNTGTSNSILYTFSGNAAIDLPLTATDYSGKVMSTTQTILGAASVVAGVAGAGVTGGASLAATGGLIASGASQIVSGGIGMATNEGITTTKGAVGGTIGAMSPLQCYLIVTRPKMVKATDYGEINGYPCMKSYILGDLQGYVKVAECNWGIQGATEEELDEIRNLMSTEGAII